MPRPKKPRCISEYPSLTAFIPEGAPVSGEVSLSVEGLEAIRLSDVKRLDQESAASRMQVSRQTYGRILAHARGVIGEALIAGKALRIEGGTYEMHGRRQRRQGRRSISTATIEKISRKGVDTMRRCDGRWPQGQRPGPQSGRGNRYAAQTTSVPNGQGSGGSGRGRGQGMGRGFRKGGGKRR